MDRKSPVADTVVPGKKDIMPTDPEPSDQAKAALKQTIATLQKRFSETELRGSDMILECRQILNAWVRGGGSSLHDAIIGFTGIESQTDHVLGGSQARIGRDVDRVKFEPGSPAEQAEVEELGRFFHDQFNRDLEDLARFLDVS